MKLRNVLSMAAVAGLFVVASTTPALAGESSADSSEARARALRDGWPDTPVGIIASGWVQAFAVGDSAMEAFLGSHVGAAQMEERPMSDRMRSYRKLYKRYGALLLHSVVKSEPSEVTVILLAEDASQHLFVFNVADEPPHELLRVGIHQPHGHGGHSGKGS